jgi:hypothetical protein
MDPQAHALAVGKLVANLQSLEFLIREYLYAKADPPHTPLPVGTDLSLLLPRTKVPINALTDYSSLAHLIARFNASIAPLDPSLVLDPTIVEIRDALAHGRISAPVTSPHLGILKFSRPTKASTSVSVTVAAEMDDAWFKTQLSRVLAELKKAAKAAGVTGI